MENMVGYDIGPEMVKMSLVNLYLHGFPNPKIYEYDTLTDDDKWSDSFDTILAIPIYALKQEKFMMYALIIRLILFSYFIFNETNYEILVFIFILLNYIQNFILKVLIFFKYNFIDLKYLFLISLFILILIFYYNDYYFFVEIVVFLLFLYSAIFLYNKKALILNLILDKKL